MFMYDLHVHSAEGSWCSGFKAKDMVKYYKEQGFAGFCLADHFTGASTVPEGAPFADRVNKIFEIYDLIKDEAERENIKVFPCLEYSIRQGTEEFLPITGNDFVIMGLTKEWLLENEAVFDLEFMPFTEEIHKAGGFIIHAHPFLEADWVKGILLFPRHVDAVECYNAHSLPERNDRAIWYAEQYDLPKTGGSDNHSPGEPLIAGVETETPCETVYDLIEAIASRKAVPFLREAKK